MLLIIGLNGIRFGWRLCRPNQIIAFDRNENFISIIWIVVKFNLTNAYILQTFKLFWDLLLLRCDIRNGVKRWWISIKIECFTFSTQWISTTAIFDRMGKILSRLIWNKFILFAPCLYFVFSIMFKKLNEYFAFFHK